MDAEKRTILGHLQELRKRLLTSLIVVAITTAVSFIFAKKIFQILILPAEEINLIYIEMTEMIGIYMKVSLTSGIVLAVPYLTYQLVMFLTPALNPKEKRYVLFGIPWVVLAFIGGVWFGYEVLIPPAVHFLITFGSDIAEPTIRIGNYIPLVTRLLLSIGFVFEMPVLTTFLARLGVITPEWLSRKRKFAIILIFVIAALVTPTIDPINQILVAAPLLVLYEVSILLAKLVQRGKVRR